MKKATFLLLTIVTLFTPQRVNAQEAQENALTTDDIVEINDEIKDLSGDALISYVEALLKIEDPTAYDEESLELSVAAIRDNSGYIKEDLANHLLKLLGEANYDDSLISESREVIEDKHENEDVLSSGLGTWIWIGIGIVVVLVLFVPLLLSH